MYDVYINIFKYYNIIHNARISGLSEHRWTPAAGSNNFYHPMDDSDLTRATVFHKYLYNYGFGRYNI